MIDVTAAPAVDETRLSQSPLSGAVRRTGLLRPTLALAAGWLVFSVGLVWFIYAGTVRVGSGHWLGQRLRVRVIWSRFLAFLAEHGANTLVLGVVTLTVALTLIGSLALLWWVAGQHNDADVQSETPVAPDLL